MQDGRRAGRWGVVSWLAGALWLLASPGGGAAPVSGSSERAAPTSRQPAGRPTARPQAAVPDSENFCEAHHVKAGRLTAFSMVNLGINSTQSVSPASDVAGAVSYADIISYLTYDHVLESPQAHTGSLRWSLWAVPQNHVAGWPKINGHRMGGFEPQLRDGSGRVNNYLYNLTEITLRERVPTVNPPAGRYCLTVMVEMYGTTNECRSTDGYCPEIVYVLGPTYAFR